MIAEPIRRCVAPAAIASAKSAVMPAEIQSASGTTARTRSAYVAQPLERRRGRLVERRDGHDSAHAQGAASGRVLGERSSASGATPPRAGVVGEVDLQQHVEQRVVLAGRRVERVGDARAVDRVDDGCRRPDRSRLVGLRLPDEVPAQAGQRPDDAAPWR